MENKSVKPISEILVANNSTMSVESVGSVSVDIDREGEHCTIPLNGVLHVPDLSINLLSVSQIVQKGHKVIFENSGCKVYNFHGNLVATRVVMNIICLF